MLASLDLLRRNKLALRRGSSIRFTTLIVQCLNSLEGLVDLYQGLSRLLRPRMDGLIGVLAIFLIWFADFSSPVSPLVFLDKIGKRDSSRFRLLILIPRRISEVNARMT